MLYTMCKACALDRQPCTASDSAMLWVDLSKSFMTFSRAVGQLLEKSRGVHAEVRKAVWSLYSRPHGSFDPLTALSAAAPLWELTYLPPCTALTHNLSFHLHVYPRATRWLTCFIFQSKGHPNDTWSPWYSHRVWLPTWHDCHASEGAITCQGCGLAMLHAASSDSAQAATTVPLSRHVARFLSLTQAQGPPAQADAQKPHRQPFVWIPPAAQHHSIAYPHAHALTQR